MAQLCQHQVELIRRRINVAIISFSALDSARAWLQETTAPFQLLLDPDRIVYQLYGLERSVFRSWSLRTLWYYARHWQQRPKQESGQDDLNQLGGDFLVDSTGILRLAYRSYDPVDRPSMDELFCYFDALGE